MENHFDITFKEDLEHDAKEDFNCSLEMSVQIFGLICALSVFGSECIANCTNHILVIISPGSFFSPSL